MMVLNSFAPAGGGRLRNVSSVKASNRRGRGDPRWCGVRTSHL